MWSRRAWVAGRSLLIVPLTGMIGRVASILVSAMGELGILHVGMLVDDGHHVEDGQGVGLEHLPPWFDVVEALMEVIDHVPVIKLCDVVMVSEVSLDVVTEGLTGVFV